LALALALMLGSVATTPPEPQRISAIRPRTAPLRRVYSHSQQLPICKQRQVAADMRTDGRVGLVGCARRARCCRRPGTGGCPAGGFVRATGTTWTGPASASAQLLLLHLHSPRVSAPCRGEGIGGVSRSLNLWVDQCGAPRGPLVAPRDRVHACHVRAMLPHSSFAFQWTHWQLALVTGALVSTGAHHHHTHTRFGKIKTHAAQAKQIKFGRAPSVDNGIILFSIFASPRKKNRMRRVTRIQ
jgi:hypothetical protein